MQHSEKFKVSMVRKMMGPSAMSANRLSNECGVGQPTLSTWLRQALLARLKKILAPTVVEIGRYSFATAELGYALLTPQPFEDDADLLLGGELPTRSASDIVDCGFGRLLLLPWHLRLLRRILLPRIVS